MFKYIVLGLIVIFFTSCATKIDIRALKPAKVNDSDVKQVSLVDFKNDTISLKNTIKSKMKNIKFDNKRYFTLVNRDITNELLKEQKLQDSGIVNSSKEIEALKDVRSIISGTINSKEHNKQYFYKRITDYSRCIEYYNDNGKTRCLRYKSFNKKCENNQYDLDVSIFISKVTNGSNIYQRDFNKHKSFNICNYSYVRQSNYQIFKEMTQNIVEEFLDDITPTYIFFEIEIMKDEDIKYNDKEMELFKSSIKNIENKNIKDANLLLKNLVFLTKHKSFVALYNYALTFEALENLDESLKFYKKAKNISLKSRENKDIKKSINRIINSINDKKEANNQIKN